MPSVGIHVFRKDLRVVDNLALNQLASRVDEVVGLFVIDPVQNKTSSHFSKNAQQFLHECLISLNQQCNGKLLIVKGNPATKLREIIKKVKAVAVSFNLDFTPYSLKRDREMAAVCEHYGIELIRDATDQSLVDNCKLIKKDDTPYMTFAPFLEQLKSHTIAKASTKRITWVKPRQVSTVSSLHVNSRVASEIIGGRSEGLKHLVRGDFKSRSDHIGAKTSKLSAYLNLGCLSVREVYWRKRSAALTRLIAWRDFLLCVYRFHPGANLHTTFIDERYAKIKWPRVNKTEWKRFVNCDTGFALIDAAMNELKTTGFISNRARLLLATFWIKYLLISPLNPTYGSQVGFSKLLVDCSSSQNKMNHLWVLGDLDFAGRRFGAKGAHPLSGRIIRIDNAMLKRYDPKLEYVTKWIPELASSGQLNYRKRKVKQMVPMFDWRLRYKEYTKLFNRIH